MPICSKCQTIVVLFLFSILIPVSLSGQNRIAYVSDNTTHIIDLQQKKESLDKSEVLKKEALVNNTEIINFTQNLAIQPVLRSSWIFCNALQSPHNDSFVYLQRDRMSAQFSINFYNANSGKHEQLFDFTNAPLSDLGFKPIAWANDPNIVYLEAFIFDDAIKHEGIWSYNLKTKKYEQLDIDPLTYTSTPILSLDSKYFLYTATSVQQKVQLHGGSDLIKIFDLEKNTSKTIMKSQSPVKLLGWTYSDISLLKADRVTYKGWEPTKSLFQSSITLYFPWEDGVQSCVTRDGNTLPPGTPGAGSVGTCSNLGSHSYIAYDFDTPNNSDEPVLASASGIVVSAYYAPGTGGYSPSGYGNWVIIEHSNSYRTLYAHLKSLNVSVGDNVNTGFIIGIEGTTGSSTGDHIHFEYELPGGMSGNAYNDFADCGCYCHPGYLYTSTNVPSSNSLDCSNPVQLTCGVMYSGGSSSATSNIMTYGCNNWTETGPERVHTITPTSSGTLTATISNFTGDLDVYILGSCDPLDCLGTVSPSSATYSGAQANQTYYIVVDSDDGSGSSYDLIVTCPTGSGGQPNLSKGPDNMSVSGTVLTIDIVVENIGNSSAGSSTVGYYASTDQNISTSDILLGIDGVSSLNSGETDSETITVDLCNVTGIISGTTYYIGYIIDKDDDVAESNEGDNIWYWSTLPQTPSCNTGQPNLTKNSDNLSVSGTVLTIDIVVENIGNSSAGSSTVGYYASTDQNISTSDILLGIDGVSSLNSGETDSETITVDLCNVTGIISGTTYFIGYIIDKDNDVIESNESDNIWYWSGSSQTCGVLPNLTQTAANLSTSGTSITIDVLVENTGNASAGSSVLIYYASLDQSLDNTDINLGIDFVPSLAVGETSQESLTVDLCNETEIVSGSTYYIFFAIDDLGQVTESNEGDNVWYWDTNPQTPTCLPNLTQTSENLSISGTTVTIDVGVENVGVESAIGSTLGYYASTDQTITTSDILLGTDGVSSLNAGETDSETITVDLCNVTGINSGTAYYMGYIIDKDNDVTESNEGDNNFIFSNGPHYTCCTFSLSPMSEFFTDVGGSSSFSVSVPNGCSWTATESCSWVNITSGSGTGNGTVSFTVDTNTSLDTRYCTIDVGGESFTITQSGIPNTYCNLEIKQTASDATSQDWLGRSVFINGNGDYAIAGAYGDDDNGSQSGSAYIFHRTGSTWTEQAKLTASDGAADDSFGFRVSLDGTGDYALIGAHGDEDNGTLSGSAYIFKRTNTTWEEQAKLTASDGTLYDKFGQALSINSAGDYAIVSSHSDDDNGNDSGSAYIFHRTGTTWTEQAKLTASDGAAGDIFGWPVSINSAGNYALIGAYGDDDNGNNSGSAYIFERNGTTWTEQAKLTASDGITYDDFGSSLSINNNGDYLIIGARADDDNGYNSGSAYFFQRNGTTWTEVAKINASDGTTNDLFGFSVSINGAGDFAYIGAYGDDDNGNLSGSTYTYQRIGSAWTELDKIIASDGGGDDNFGRYVSINSTGEYAIAGAHGEDENGANSGAAYIYQFSQSPIEITWIGGSGLWNDPDNWDLGHVPQSCNDVIIPSGEVILTTGKYVLINTIEVMEGAILEVAPGTVLIATALSE